MSYFNIFGYVPYRFGDETTVELFQNISLYADIIDQVKNNSVFYNRYYIQDRERPDQLSFKLYRTTSYYWTFYLLNDHLRSQGWPLTNESVVRKAELIYPNYTLTTRTNLRNQTVSNTTIFKVGQTVTGAISLARGVIVNRNLDLGQIIVEMIQDDPSSPKFFRANENVFSTGDYGTEFILVDYVSREHLAAHHYENGDGEIVDIDPTVGPGELLTEVTNLDRYIAGNEDIRLIKVIRPSVIRDVTNAFKEAIQS